MSPKWGEITAGEILTPIQGELISGPASSKFAGLSTDTRDIKPGQLFLALKGEYFDGHDFLAKAIEKGASGLVANKSQHLDIPANSNVAFIVVPDSLKALGDLAGWWRRLHHVKVAAITGSVGKTTVKEMAADILGLTEKTLKNPGNLNNLIGLPLTILTVTEKDRRAVLEMGMNRPGEIARLTEIADPDIGLITNVAKAHLEGVGDIMGVARAKAELLENISPNAQLIINGDDQLLVKTASPFRKRLIMYGINAKNDIQATKIQDLGQAGISFELQYSGKSLPAQINVPGMHNLYNALAASAIAICVDESPDHITKGLSIYKGVKGRFSLIPLSGDIMLVDDTYNANPASLRAAMNAVQELAQNRRLIVGLGEMMELGKETVSAHLEAGYMAATMGASHLFTMGEHAQEMISGALDAGFPSDKAMMVYSHDEMAKRMMDIMQHGDLILLKGSRKMRLETTIEKIKGCLLKEDEHAEN